MSTTTVTTPNIQVANTANVDSLGNDTSNKTTAGKLVSNAGDIASSILGVTKKKQNQETLNIQAANVKLQSAQLQQAAIDSQNKTKNILIISGSFVVVIGVLSYVLFINKNSKIV